MNCDDFLAAQETGGLFRRMLARRHAARCPRCATLQTTFAAMKRDLTSADPLSPRARQLWQQAADEPADRSWPLRNWLAITGGLAAAACVVLLVVKLAGHKPVGPMPAPPQVVKRIEPAVTPPMVTVIDTQQQLAQLADAAGRLEADLQDLRLDAQRADARREIAKTVEHFDKW